MFNLVDKDFKPATTNTFKDLKNTMPKELKYDNNVSPNREYQQQQQKQKLQKRIK